MLHGIQGSPVELALHEMQKSKFDFPLTGSRFFQHETSYSDWDFFIEDNDEWHVPGDDGVGTVRAFLNSLGFVPAERDENYRHCAQIIELYEFDRRTDPEDWSEVIHVQLVVNAQLKQHIQEVIKKWWPHAFKEMSKSERKAVWNSYFEAITNDPKVMAFGHAVPELQRTQRDEEKFRLAQYSA